MISLVPYMAVINLFILLIYVIVVRHYRWSAADLQRLDAVSRSPIQASLAEGLDGSTTIRAFRKNDYFLKIFQDQINENSSAMIKFRVVEKVASGSARDSWSLCYPRRMSLCQYHEQAVGIITGAIGLTNYLGHNDDGYA